MNIKVKDFVRQNIGYAIVGVTCVVYIFTALFIIEKTGKSVEQIIADGVIAYILGISINKMFELQGFINGERDERVIKASELHAQKVDAIEPYITLLDDWVEEQNKIELKKRRKRILAREGLAYKNYFDDEGLIINYYELQYKKTDTSDKKWQERRKLFCFRRALHVKITYLTTQILTSEGSVNKDTFNLGRSKKKFEASLTRKDFISKAAIAFVIGYYGITLIQDFSWASLIWTAFQVCIFLTLGVIRMFRTYSYMTEEYKSRLIKKVDLLTKFEKYAEALKGDNNGGKTEISNV